MYTRKYSSYQGFTIIEVLVIVIIIGILAGMVTLGFTSWKKATADSVAKSDLNMIIVAMENAKNFGSGYPTSVPSSVKPSSGVTLTYEGGDSTGYCVKAVTSTGNTLHVDTRNGGSATLQTGSCAPAPPPPLLANKVTNGGGFTCAIATNGVPYCWGFDYGRLGRGNGSTTDTKIPYPVDTSGVLAGKTVTDISAGESHVCAIASGNAYCWGANHLGQLGSGDLSQTVQYSPVAVSTSGALSGKTVTKISSGKDYTCAIASGSAYCWGYGGNGRLGNGVDYDQRWSPAAVSTSTGLSGKTITDIAAGSRDTTCAIASGQLYCWGSNSDGLFATGASGAVTNTSPVRGDSTNVLVGKTPTSLSVGNNHACVLANSVPYCWGRSYNGEMGTAAGYSYNLMAVDTSGALSGQTLTKIQAKGSSTCAVASSKAYCWGKNGHGELGTGVANNTSNSAPAAVVTSGVLGTKTVTDIGLGVNEAHGCVVANNKVFCYGRNVFGQLGNNTTTDSNVPVAVP
jgi:alpha-tubulin suppressor-like RCC1 family protein